MAKRRFRSRGRFRRLRRRRGGRRLKKFVKGVVRRMSEAKWNTIQYLSGGAIPSGTYTIVDITPQFPQGTDKFTRLGNNIKYKRLHIRGTAALLQGVAAPTFANYRLIFFVSRAGLSPSIGQVLDNTSFPQAIYSTVQQQNARVIRDKHWIMSTVGNGSEVMIPSGRTFRFSVRLGNNVNFTSSATAIPSNPLDHIYLAFASDATVTTAFPTLALNCRITYVDI